MHSSDEHFLAIIEAQLSDWFGNQPVLSRKTLLERVATLNPTLKQTTLDVYLHRLTQRNQLTHAGRGVYALPGGGFVAKFTPTVPPELANLWQAVATELFLSSGCAWTTQWLNNFTTHQLMRTVQLIEVAPEALQSTYYALKDRLGGRVFLQPDARVQEHRAAFPMGGRMTRGRFRWADRCSSARKDYPVQLRVSRRWTGSA